MKNIEIIKKVQEHKKEIISSMLKMLEIKSISPISGGTGESERADYLQKLLSSLKFKTKRYDYKDESNALRSNLISSFGFETGKRKIWLVAHMDTVAPGETSLWKTNPFKPYATEDRIYGRGSSDNGQDLIASVYAMKIVSELTKTPRYAFGLALVADEEMGSKYGIQRLIAEGVFDKNDLILVPDAGDEKGMWIEIAEKGMLWLRFTITGKQIHASIPDNGLNAYQHSIEFLLNVRTELCNKFNATNDLFSPNYSTFELTKHEANVESINIISGTEISYMDCRVLPEYNLDDVIKLINSNADRFEKQNKGIKILVETVNREDAAPPTNPNSELVKIMSEKITDCLGMKPKIIGIGGGTCAAFFRKAGMDAVAWSIDNQMAHQIDEYCLIDSMLKDTVVFASLFL